MYISLMIIVFSSIKAQKPIVHDPVMIKEDSVY
jgi:hypothetical protein